MISYLDISFSSQTIIKNNIPDLFHLVRFALAGVRLQIENLRNTVAPKYVMTTLDPHLKPEALEKLRHSGEGDVCVSIAS
jgi:hypothetical protein